MDGLLNGLTGAGSNAWINAGLLVGAAIYTVWKLGGGRRADRETKPKLVDEGSDTRGLSMRDLLVVNLRTSASAEDEAKRASASCSDLGAKLDENHKVTIAEITRLDGRIDGALKVATEAAQLARAAAGGRQADEVLRSQTPPGGMLTPPTGVRAVRTEG
jgi:hypothetical protein